MADENPTRGSSLESPGEPDETAVDSNKANESLDVVKRMEVSDTCTDTEGSTSTNMETGLERLLERHRR